MNIALSGPLARLILRYGAGALFGSHLGSVLAGDPDAVAVLSAAIVAGVEVWYHLAKKHGWPT